MAHNYIIQWNCRGLRSNREDIELLISKYSPAAICLQETMLTPHQTQTFKHYSAYYKSGIHGHGGVCILVKDKFIHSQVQFQDKFIHSQVQFQADLQAVAVCITINNKTYTVASVYVPPSETLNELAFDRMVNSFSSRYLIQGCQPVRNFRILYGFYMQNTGVRIWPRKYGNWALSVLSLKVLLPEQSLPVLGSKSVRICGILCLRTFKYLFNHQNIQSSLFHM